MYLLMVCYHDTGSPHHKPPLVLCVTQCLNYQPGYFKNIIKNPRNLLDSYPVYFESLEQNYSTISQLNTYILARTPNHKALYVSCKFIKFSNNLKQHQIVGQKLISKAMCNSGLLKTVTTHLSLHLSNKQTNSKLVLLASLSPIHKDTISNERQTKVLSLFVKGKLSFIIFNNP